MWHSAYHRLLFGFQKNKWELVDMGSLNGTFLNSQLISHPDSGSRHRGDPVELSSGDIITLGTTSNVHVSQVACLIKLFFSI
jgi:pSer/pThr/pTyr-binding forkhead associated (FHA) protein